MQRRSLWIISALLAGAVLAATPAWAHKIDVFVYRDGPQLKGEGGYDEGSPAGGAQIKVTDASGQVVGQARTDPEGGFVLPWPGGKPPWEVEINDGGGHRGVFVLTADEAAGASQASSSAPATAPSNAPHPAAQAAGTAGVDRKALADLLRQELAPIKAQLARLGGQNQVGVKDIIGGLGWIAGLAGLALWWTGRRERRGGDR